MNIAIIMRRSLVSMKDGRSMSGNEAVRKNMAFKDLEKRGLQGEFVLWWQGVCGGG